MLVWIFASLFIKGAPSCSPHRCHCGEVVNSLGHHGLSCSRSAGHIARHANINDIIRRALVTVGVPAVLEPHGLARDDVSKCQTTPYRLMHMDEIHELAMFDDAQHRGPNFYDYSGNSNVEPASTLEKDEDSSLEFSKYSDSSTDTSSGSSKETSEKRRVTKMYRTCTPCLHDMLKKHTNIGIKWICASYQQARRSFKSVCMMRYRNCQDGTMFVKLYDRKCKDDPVHGRSWFYEYKV